MKPTKTISIAAAVVTAGAVLGLAAPSSATVPTIEPEPVVETVETEPVVETVETDVTPKRERGNNKVGRTSAVWNGDCSVVTAHSTKDISNVVYRIDGVDYRIEFQDGTHELDLPGEISDLWIKAGNNKSKQGPGYGEHYERPADCEAGI